MALPGVVASSLPEPLGQAGGRVLVGVAVLAAEWWRVQSPVRAGRFRYWRWRRAVFAVRGSASLPHADRRSDALVPSPGVPK